VCDSEFRVLKCSIKVDVISSHRHPKQGKFMVTFDPFPFNKLHDMPWKMVRETSRRLLRNHAWPVKWRRCHLRLGCRPIHTFHSCGKAYTHTHTRLMALFPGLPRLAGTRKAKPIWILLKQETMSGSGISWAICKSAPISRQITTPAPHHPIFYRLDALPAAQPGRKGVRPVKN